MVTRSTGPVDGGVISRGTTRQRQLLLRIANKSWRWISCQREHCYLMSTHQCLHPNLSIYRTSLLTCLGYQPTQLPTCFPVNHVRNPTSVTTSCHMYLPTHLLNTLDSLLTDIATNLLPVYLLIYLFGVLITSIYLICSLSICLVYVCLP